MGKSMSDRVSRIKGSAIGARVFGIFTWAILTCSIAIGYFTAMHKGWMYAAGGEAILLFILLRPLFMGVGVSSDRLVVWSWYRYYSMSRNDIRSISWRPYSGMLNRFNRSGFLDPLYSHASMLMVNPISGNTRCFPATIAADVTVQRVAVEAGASLDVRVHEPDLLAIRK